MPLGMEVGLGPGDIVLDGDPAPPKRDTAAPLLGACLLWPNGRPSQQLLSSCLYLILDSTRVQMNALGHIPTPLLSIDG